MKTRTKVLLGAGGLVATAASAVMVTRMMGAAMFEPGTVVARVARKGESLDPPPQVDAPASAWRVTPRITLHHESQGSGPDLLLVHGGPGYPPKVPWKVASPLALSFRVHSYHQRGCGQSTRPFDRAPGSSFYAKLKAVEDELGLAEQIADIERIRKILGAERLVLIGHSIGGLIAALYAAEMPQRVRALVLVAPAPLVVMPKQGGPDLFGLVEARLPNAATREEFLRYRSALFDFGNLIAQDESSLSRTFGRFRGYYGLATARSVPIDDGEVGGFLSLAIYASLGKRHDWRAAMARVKAPTLVVHGADDLQPEADSRAVAAPIPGARFVVLSGASHFVPDDSPEELARLVVQHTP